MLIYLFLTLIILILFRFLGNKRGLIISFVIFTVLAMLRSPYVGSDTIQYFENYTRIGEYNTWIYENSRYEIGFFYLVKILYHFNDNPQTLIVVSSIFINLSFFIFVYKHSSNYLVSSLIYLWGNMFFSNMNIMRQAIAVSILVLGFTLLENKKYITYLLIVFIASLFHDVAWAAIILILIKFLPVKRWSYLFVIIISVLIFILYTNFFDLLTSIMGHEEYMDSKYGVSNYYGAIFNFIIPLIAVGIPVIYSIMNNYDKDKKSHNYICIFLVYLCFVGLVIRMNIFNRVAGLFGVYLLIIIPHFIDSQFVINENLLLDNLNMYNINRDRIVLTFISLSIYCVSFFVVCYTRPEWFECVPYSFFWL